jgi:hypothetical protein
MHAAGFEYALNQWRVLHGKTLMQTASCWNTKPCIIICTRLALDRSRHLRKSEKEGKNDRVRDRFQTQNDSSQKMQSIDNQQYRVSQTEKYQHESSDLSIHDILSFHHPCTAAAAIQQVTTLPNVPSSAIDPARCKRILSELQPFYQ